MPCKICNKHVPIENRDTGVCATCNKKARDKDDLYSLVREAFITSAVKHGVCCPRCGKEIEKTDDVHHKMGRVGYADDWARKMDIELVHDVRFFLAVDRTCHHWIETHPKEAKEKGWSLSRLAVNNVSPINAAGLEEIQRLTREMEDQS